MASTVNILNLYSDIENLSVKQLHRTRLFIDQLIKDRTPEDKLFISNLDANDYVSYEPEFINNQEHDSLFQDISSIDKFKPSNTNSSNTKSVWLSTSSQSYDWTAKSGLKYVHDAVSIEKFPSIYSLLQKVNGALKSNLNSCLLTLYPNGGSGIRLHDDCDPPMDNTEPIAVISLGSTRTIELFQNYKSPSLKPCKSLNVSKNSLYVIKAGCQKYFRHRVPSQRGIIDLESVFHSGEY